MNATNNGARAGGTPPKQAVRRTVAGAVLAASRADSAPRQPFWILFAALLVYPLGYLFQHQSISTRKTDLVIEVTPRIMPDQQ